MSDASSLSLGVIAVAIQLLLLARPHNKNLLFWLPLAMFMWSGHYFLLGSTAAAALHIFAACTMYLAHFNQKKGEPGLKILVSLILFLNLLIGLALYSQPADFFMTFGNILFSYCHFCLREKNLRVGYIVSEVIIACGAFMLGSVPGVGIAVLMIIINLSSLVRWKGEGIP